MTIDELRREALGLDLRSRASLARDFLSSLHHLSEGEIEQLWLEEAVRRDAALDAGSPSSDAADVLSRARARRE